MSELTVVRGFFAVELAALFILGLAIRSQTTPVEVYLQVGLLATVGTFATYMALVGGTALQRQRGRLPAMIRYTVAVWVPTVLVAAYGMFLSVQGGWNTELGMALAVRYTPILLLPAFVYTLRFERQWRLGVYFFVGLGVASALVDLSTLDLLDTHLTRLVSGDFFGVYHEYALVLTLLILVIGVTDGWLRAALIVGLPPLLWRTLLSLSRGPMFLAAVACVYGFAVATRFQLGKLVKRLAVVGVMTAVLWVPVRDVTSTRVADAYEVAFLNRTRFLGWAVDYRLSELRSALHYGGLTGEGWGSSEDFSRALNFTTSSEAVATKSYVHNLFGFFWWKLGVLGGALVGFLLYYLVREIRESARRGDRTGLVIGGNMALWFMHAMVNMNFARPELNLMVCASLAYFVARRQWGDHFFEGTPWIVSSRKHERKAGEGNPGTSTSDPRSLNDPAPAGG